MLNEIRNFFTSIFYLKLAIDAFIIGSRNITTTTINCLTIIRLYNLGEGVNLTPLYISRTINLISI